MHKSNIFSPDSNFHNVMEKFDIMGNTQLLRGAGQ